MQERVVGKERSVRRADLAAAAIIVSPSGHFDPDDRHARLSELACHALTQSRVVSSRSLVDALISEKLGNPMLGLFAAHLMVKEMTKSPDGNAEDGAEDKALFRTVTDHLLGMLGPDHPDLQTLWWQRGEGAQLGDGRLHVLPMLRASWELTVARSIKTFDVLSLGTFFDKLPRIMPTAPWVILMDNEWAASDEAVTEYLNAREHAHLSRAQAEAALRAEAMAKRFFKRAYSTVLNLVPASVARYLPSTAPAIDTAGPPADSAAAPAGPSVPVIGSDEKAELSRALGLPASVLDSILRKIGH
jgi:hypothetical protein